MNKYSFFWLLSVSALTCAACTQEPAEVVYKGSEFFGREHEGVVNSPNPETFDEDSPRYKPGYARPVTDAAVPPVAVSDLPPPSTGTHVAANSQNNLKPHFLNKNTDSSVEMQDQPIVQAKPASASAHVADSSASPQFVWPVNGGKIISRFSSADGANGKGNDGINIAISEGEPIFAVADGTVVYSGSELAGYGNMVILRHADGWMTAYAHARSLAVKKGAKVKQSDLIAYVGSTGAVKSPQVHFVMRKDKTPVDPEKYLPHAG